MNDNEFLNLDFTDFKLDPNLSRRDLLKALGGGIVIFFCVGDSSVLEAQRRGGAASPTISTPFSGSAPNGRVTCYTGKIEMGQGIITSLAQMLADELDVSLESVDMVMGDTSLCPWDMGTFGSMSTRFFGPPLRAAGAEARRVLLELAAEQLKVPQERLVAENGVIFDRQQKDKRVTYGELAKGKTIARRAKEKPALKKSVRVQGDEQILPAPGRRGEGHRQGPVRRRHPAAGHAVRQDPPAAGPRRQAQERGHLRRREDRGRHRGPRGRFRGRPAQESRPGGRGPVEDQGRVRPLALHARRSEHLRPSAQERRQRRTSPRRAATSKKGEKLAAIVVEQTYLDGYKAHAAMETHTALAQVEGNKATVWVSTQTPFPAKDEIAKALGFAADNVRVITPFVGRRFRRQELRQQPGGRGRPAVQGDRQARPGVLEPGGGVLLSTPSVRRPSSRSSPASPRTASRCSGTTTSTSPATAAHRTSTTSRIIGR